MGRAEDAHNQGRRRPRWRKNEGLSSPTVPHAARAGGACPRHGWGSDLPVGGDEDARRRWARGVGRRWSGAPPLQRGREEASGVGELDGDGRRPGRRTRR